MKANLTVLGRLTKDLELISNTVKGTEETFYSTKGTVAFNDYKKNSHFLRFEVTGPKAELLVDYSQQGSRVCLSGSLESYQYEHKGENVTNWTLRVSDFEIIDWAEETEPEVVETKPQRTKRPVRK